MELQVGKVYRHFKGDLYLVEAIARHTETDEKMVIYRALYDEHILYARPYDMFCSKVDKEKYPNETQEYRFELANIETVAKNYKK